MKALTLTQPWASLVASGAKRIETRSWRTSYRGPVAIHAAKTFPPYARALCTEEPFRWRLLGALLCPDDDAAIVAALPLGKILAVSWIEDVLRVEETPRDEEEESFGDFFHGRFAWRLREPIDIAEIDARGALGLWEIPDELIPEYARRAIRTPI